MKLEMPNRLANQNRGVSPLPDELFRSLGRRIHNRATAPSGGGGAGDSGGCQSPRLHRVVNPGSTVQSPALSVRTAAESR